MASSDETDNRARKVAAVLRPLGRGPLTRVQAKRAGQLLDVHWTTVYRLRQRFLADPVISALDPQHRGPTPGGRRLSPAVDNIIQEVVQSWLPAQRQLAHPASDLVLEIRRRCVAARLEPPSRSTVARRWPEHREQDALRRAAVFAVPCGVMRRAGQKKCRLVRRTTAAPGASHHRRLPAATVASSGLTRKREGREERVRDEGHGYGFKGIGCLNNQECLQPH